MRETDLRKSVEPPTKPELEDDTDLIMGGIDQPSDIIGGSEPDPRDEDEQDRD